MPLQQTSGNSTTDAYGGGTAVAPVYIEDVMSTFLYTGNDAIQIINNGINLADKGGLVWLKRRTTAGDHSLYDTQRGIGQYLKSNSTDKQNLAPTGSGLTAFNSTGFSLGLDWNQDNSSGDTFASWTFRKQPKFFDVVTYTGTGSARTIAHNLGSVPGCIIVKSTSDAEGWFVYHQTQGNTKNGYLNYDSPFAVNYTPSVWNDTTPTSSVFTLGTRNEVNGTGKTFVAYIFAHNAGGFGATGTDNVISCGSYSPDGSGNVAVTLGYEPQWLLFKTATGTDNWKIQDTMRGASQTTYATLFPSLSIAEDAGSSTSYHMIPNATGFTMSGQAAGTYIYIAIRRGPMKVPTDGTKVFKPLARTGTGSAATVTGAGFPPDLVLHRARLSNVVTPANMWQDRLRGIQQYLKSNNTNAEFADTAGILSLTMDGMTVGTDVNEGNVNTATAAYINYFFQRAPSFFDEVCYTGTGVTRTINHNLGVVPEFMIIKGRTGSPTYNWICYHKSFASNQVVELNTTTGVQNNGGAYDISTLSSTVFGLKTGSDTNGNGNLQVAYLFATCPGVSKVGSYTGTGATQTIACGFAAGARFVLIKRTDSTGNWMTFDTARGMTVLTNPFLSLNSTAAETATLGACTTVTTGFAVNEAILTGINTNGASYIFLAVA